MLDHMESNGGEQYRIEKDSLGEVRVPAHRYWGAQTERSRQNFPIGHELIPPEVISASEPRHRRALRGQGAPDRTRVR